MTRTEELADRVETWLLDDGTLEERVYVDGRLWNKRHIPPQGACPRGYSVSAWLPEEFV